MGATICRRLASAVLVAAATAALAPAAWASVSPTLSLDQSAGTTAGTGAKIKTLSISHGHLTIVPRKAASNLTVEIHGSLLSESAALRARASRTHRLPLTVTTENTRGARTVMRVDVSS